MNDNSSLQSARPADLVLRGGRIYTVDERQPWAEAVAIRDGVYVAVGSQREIEAWIGADTEVVDLHGAMAMPGINDAHQHPLDGGYESLFGCNFSPTLAFDAILDAIREHANQCAPGDWIVGGAWGSQHVGHLADIEALRALDEVSGGHPVYLRDDTYHNRWVNSVAMELAGIGRDSPSPAGSEIVKDPSSGEPSGLLKEFPAFSAIEKLIPPRTPERMAQAAAASLRLNNELGITAIHEAYSGEAYLEAWTGLDKTQGLSAWLVGSLPIVPAERSGIRNGEELLAMHQRYRTAHVRPDFAKLFLDGVPPARTSLFLEPYLEDAEHGADYRGPLNHPLEQLSGMLAEVDRLGFPIKLHATGDGSVRLALDAIEAVRRCNGADGPRHLIAHASFIDPADLPRFKVLNVVADQSPMFWFPTGAWYAIAAVIGQERAERFWPVRELLTSGALLAGGSDWPAGQDSPNPWIGIEGLVTRRNPLGEVPGVLWPEQAIDLATALRLYTRDSAEAMGLGETTGAIEPGRSADLIVLDRPLFEIPIEQVHETRIAQTYFQGRRVYSRS
jgi:predicted amidohydrolase YtcJ